MAMIDKDWSRSELVSALTDGSHIKEPESQEYLAYALKLSGSNVTQQKGAELMPPSKEGSLMANTFDEIIETNLEEDFKYMVNDQKDDLEKLNLGEIESTTGNHQEKNQSLVGSLKLTD